MNTMVSQSLSYPSVGQRIRLRRPASTGPIPRGAAGLTGMVHAVVTVAGREKISVKMDQLLTDAPIRWVMNLAEEWQNCLEWSMGEETLSTFLADCELLPSFFPVVGQRLRLVREVDREPYFLARTGVTGTLVFVDLTPGQETLHAQMDDPLSADAARQAEIEVEWRNCIEWDNTNTVAAFFQDCALYPAIGGGFAIDVSALVPAGGEDHG